MKTIKLLILCIFLCSSSYADLTLEGITSEGCFYSDSTGEYELIIGMITDLHYDATEPRDSGAYDSLSNLQTAIADWERSETDINVLLGDNVDGDDKASDDASITNINTELSSTTGTSYVMLGSHDTEQYTTSEIVSKFDNMPSAYYSFDINGIHVVVLDDNESYFGITDEELAWFEADLAATSYPTIVFFHPRTDVDYPGDTSNYYERGDSANQLSSWSLSGVTLDNSNYYGFYWSLVDVAGTRTLSLYKDTAKTELVSEGSRSGDGSLTLTAQNDSGVSGSVTVAYTEDDTDAGDANNIAQGEFTYHPYGDVSLDADVIRAAIENSGKVKYVFNGHIHKNISNLVNGIRYIGINTANTSETYAVVYIKNNLENITVIGKGNQSSYIY